MIALSDMRGYKAPDPDGFIMAFWKFCWLMMQLFKEFHSNKYVEHNLNAIFMLLIPKKGWTDGIKEFRPINLVGSLFRLPAKLLANKQKK